MHTASCAKMSGDCNASVEKASYKKGDLVAPEDLDRMWGALQKELDDADDPDGAGPEKKTALKPVKIALDASVEGETAEEQSSGSGSGGGKTASANGATTASAPASIATQAARRFWRATASALGLGGGASDGPSSHALEFGALGMAALAAIVYALRRKT